jgi:monoamine oxidase
MEENADVIIVGAGFAGVTAARELSRKGKSVIVLEARDRVGGRAMPGSVAGATIDFGGQWVGADHNLLRSLAAEVGAELYPQYTAGKSILDVDGKTKLQGEGLSKLPMAALAELGIGFTRIEAMLKKLPSTGPWDAPKADKWDAESFGSWLEKNTLTSTSLSLATLVSNAIFCSAPSRVSLLYALECFRQGGGVEKMLDVEGGNQQDKVTGGAWKLLKEAADDLSDHILLNSPVTEIIHEPGSVRVVTPHGEYSASDIIVTVPPSALGAVTFTPPLPARHRALRERMVMGSVIKAFIAYERPFWRQDGLSGDVTSTDSPLGVVSDQTEDPDGPGVLVILIEGDHAVELADLSTEERRHLVVSELIRLFGAQAGSPIDYVDYDWGRDPWAGGGYACYMPPGVLTSFGRTIREPVGSIHWAGTETARNSMGYFEGAIESGIRAAHEVTG